MTIFNKFCPTCSKLQKYTSSSALWLANKNNSECKKCSSLKKAKRNGSASPLLSETLESYYWLGFILADGHISNNRLSVSLSIKDENHLLKLAEYLKTNVSYREVDGFKQCSISLMDTLYLEELVTKYNIQHNKTENPPDISKITGNNLIALSIGFIDGDGSIGNQYNRVDFAIRVKAHHSWLNTLFYMYGASYLDKNNYAISSITNTTVSKKLKKFAVDNNLPTLKRKWDVIDLDYKSRQEISQERIIIVREMLSQNIKRKLIKQATGLKDSSLSQLIKRHKL